MTAWQALKAVSALTIGTAWQLLTNPKTSGAGVVLSNGYEVSLADALTAEVSAPVYGVEVSTAPYEVIITTDPLVVAARDGPLSAQLQPNITVEPHD